MTTFLTAILWGTGLSIGPLASLIAWVMFRKIFFKERDDTYLAIHRKSLECLRERNLLTVETNMILERMVRAIGDDEDDDSEGWKNGVDNQDKGT